MVSEHTLDVAKRSEEIYNTQLRQDLEKHHLHQFVAIEPESREFFVGETLSEAIQAARRAHPDRISFALRVGHSAAIHLGVLSA